MKPRLPALFLLTAAAALLPPVARAQATNPPYLSQFPPAQRIQTEVKGTDPMETAARQLGAYWQLRELVYDLAWRTQRRYRTRATADENRIAAEYDAGYAAAFRPYESLQKTKSHPDWLKWSRMRTSYENNPEYLDELLRQFFPAEFRAGYYRITGKRPPQPVTAPPPSGPPSAPATTSAESAADIWQRTLRQSFSFSGKGDFFIRFDSDGAYIHCRGLITQNPRRYTVEMRDGRVVVTLAPLATIAPKPWSFALQPDGSLQSLGIHTFGWESGKECAVDVLRPDPKKTAGGATSPPAGGVQPAPLGPPTGSNTGAYFAEGKKYFFAKEYAKAIGPLEKAIALDPRMSEAHYLLSVSYSVLGRHQDALPAAKEAVRLKPTEHTYHFSLGLAYFNLKQYESARSSLQQALRLNADFSHTHYWLGRVYAEHKQYEDAISALREALRLAPDDANVSNVYRDLGAAYYLLKRYPQALEATQRSLSLKPNHALAQLNLGRILLGMGRREEAMQAYRTLLTLDKQKAQELYAEISKSK